MGTRRLTVSRFARQTRRSSDLPKERPQRRDSKLRPCLVGAASGRIRILPGGCRACVKSKDESAGLRERTEGSRKVAQLNVELSCRRPCVRSAEAAELVAGNQGAVAHHALVGELTGHGIRSAVWATLRDCGVSLLAAPEAAAGLAAQLVIRFHLSPKTVHRGMARGRHRVGAKGHSEHLPAQNVSGAASRTDQRGIG